MFDELMCHGQHNSNHTGHATHGDVHVIQLTIVDPKPLEVDFLHYPLAISFLHARVQIEDVHIHRAN